MSYAGVCFRSSGDAIFGCSPGFARPLEQADYRGYRPDDSSQRYDYLPHLIDPYIWTGKSITDAGHRCSLGTEKGESRQSQAPCDSVWKRPVMLWDWVLSGHAAPSVRPTVARHAPDKVAHVDPQDQCPELDPVHTLLTSFVPTEPVSGSIGRSGLCGHKLP